MAYLQFDGTTNESNAHRKVGNLFDVANLLGLRASNFADSLFIEPVKKVNENDN